MRIKDPLHGIININNAEKKIIDSSEFQRLRRIKQLGLVYLVYPGAMHTRFEHSLGTMHVAGRMAKILNLDVEKARLIGLIHDIGHVAFSHDGEFLLKKFGFNNHEELGWYIINNSEIKDVIAENFTLNELKNSIEEKLISFSLGADRMDYLKRDALFTGVAYGIIEDDILIDSLRLVDGRICIKESAIEAVESFFIGRFMMFNAVYLHKTVRIIKEMLFKSLEEANLSLDDLLKGDEFVLDKMVEQGIELAKRLRERRLFKVVKENEHLLVSKPPSIVKKHDVYILTKEGDIRPIEEVSTLVRDLRKAEQDKRKVLFIGDKV